MAKGINVRMVREMADQKKLYAECGRRIKTETVDSILPRDRIAALQDTYTNECPNESCGNVVSPGYAAKGYVCDCCADIAEGLARPY